MIDQDKALTLSKETGEPYEGHTYLTRVAKGLDERFVRLSLVRMIGMAEREFATSVSRDTDDPFEFRQRCHRAWTDLEKQHHVSRRAGI
jgi:hypothetical protein